MKTNEPIEISVSYGKPIPQMDDASKVFIVDFSYPRQQLLELAQRMNSVVVLDHHATAQQDLNELTLPGKESKIIFNMAKSGAVLTCEYFHGESLKCEVGQLGEFFAYLQDRDLWTFKLPQSREVSMALRSYPMDFKTWSSISGIVVSGQIYEMPGICIDKGCMFSCCCVLILHSRLRISGQQI